MTEKCHDENKIYRVWRGASETIVMDEEGNCQFLGIPRPMGYRRFTSSHNFYVKNNSNEFLEPDAYAWLVNRFVERWGMSLTKKTLRDSILAAVKFHEFAHLQKADEESFYWQKTEIDIARSRMGAWKQLLSLGGLSDSEDLEKEVLDMTLLHDN